MVSFRFKKILPVFAVSLFVHGCGYGEREVSVESCDDNLVISDCKWKGQLFSCMVENRMNKNYPGVPIWKYDDQEQMIEKAPYIYAAAIPPSGKRRETLPVTKYNKDVTVKVVFCRKQPAEHGSPVQSGQSGTN